MESRIDQLLEESGAAARIANILNDRPPEPTSLARESKPKEVAWPRPEALPDALRPVPAFDARLLPGSLRGWISDIAERIGCPLDFPAVAAVVALSSVIGNKIRIRPKRHDDWTVIPNLWGAIVGRPGVLKSPAIAEAVAPLRPLEKEAAEQYAAELAEYERARVIAEAAREDYKRRVKEALAKDGDPESVEAGGAVQSDKPKCRRFIVNDCTVEKLQEILGANPHGVLHLRDELSGWLHTMNREGHENDRSFFLEAWNGDGAYICDRIARGTIRIESCVLSLFGSIQPGPLAAFLRGSAKGGAGDDGLLQRLQLLVYPDACANWTNIDRAPDLAVRNQGFKLFRALSVEREPPITLKFDSDAQDVFDGWREELERKVRAAGLHPAMAAHLSKYRSLMPSLALIFHVADIGRFPTEPVPLESVQRAAAWCDLLEARANRVYQTILKPSASTARLLAEKLRGKDRSGLPDPFRLRDVYRKQWTGLTEREEVSGAVELLEELAWLRSERIEGDAGGRPTMVYHVNPRMAEVSNEIPCRVP